MKKPAYIAGSFLLGVMVAASAGTVSAKVKSLIGQKVTGEMSVVVNGNPLEDKGAVIDGKTTVPEAVGKKNFLSTQRKEQFFRTH